MSDASGRSILPATPPSAASARPSVIQLVFREKGALYAAYVSVFSDGGLFVPSTREYQLGDDIYLLLSLPGDPQRYPVAGKVGWITPANTSGGRTQGWPTWTTPLMRWAKSLGAITWYAHSASGLQIDPAAATRRLLAE